MKKPSIPFLIFFLLLAVNISAVIPVHLRCEHLNNPLGIDEDKPRFTWQLESSQTDIIQVAYEIIIGTDSADVASGIGNMWKSDKTASDRLLAVYAGEQLKPYTRYYWSVRVWDNQGAESVSATEWFETGNKNQWKGPWISDRNRMETKPAPYFRKSFRVDRKIRSARAYIAVGGLYELYFNGNKIGDRCLDPMFTRYDRRILYSTYDVTNQINPGENTIGVLLGNGWYNYQSIAIWYFDRAPWRNRPTFCMDLRLEYEDGEVEMVSTGNDWKTSLSPVIFNSIYTAEHYDARLEQPDWNKIEFDDSHWEYAVYRSAPSQNIVSQQLHPIRQTIEIPAKTVRKFNDSLYVFDIGRNISGVSQIRINAPEGTVVRLKHGERLTDNGRVDLTNIDAHYRPIDDSDPFQTDIYIASGHDSEEFMARFNYKGFQYVEVSADKPIELSTANLTAYFMHNDVPSVGHIHTPNKTVNGIWEATNNAYLSNLLGFPTDCPQREKNGWTGDAHINIETALYNFDGITVYEKWLNDHIDEQQPNGTLPAIIPTSGDGYAWANGPDWTSTIAIIPWNVYLFYGDSRLLERCYDNIKKYVDLITDLSPNYLTSWGLGDWVPVHSQTPVELTSSIYYYLDTDILARTARLFGRKDDYIYYSTLAGKIKDAINTKYLDRSTGTYANGTQTALSAPLCWGIVPEDIRQQVADNLAQRVITDGRQIDVGLLGSKTILNALSENGYSDLAWELASRETYPSWGWWIVNGATTLYENWDISAERDISLNHIMFGEIGAWFYKALGGIKPDSEQPGFRNILLKPQFVSGLKKANVSFNSPYGIINSSWERKGKSVIYWIMIPAGAETELYLPGGYQVKDIKCISDVKKKIEQRQGYYKLGSGEYQIKIFEN